ncbi:hypothetical protein [Chromobacterium sp. Panama]|uniref:hypothetical protein n=1 Tax=Chromobacterium sp. Panama TaxID=2161826 RepID=UPI0011B27575|nr:hypothetical protein [Chromobacterium sp. Panama]
MHKSEPTEFLETSSATDYDTYVRQAVQAAINDPAPSVPDEEVKAYFAKKRMEILSRLVD